jgi:hypothetical protein
VTAWAAVGHAQAQPRPQFISVQAGQVKPEMVDAFQNLIKTEQVPALKKAGVPWRWVFTAAPFGQGFTFVRAGGSIASIRTEIARYLAGSQLGNPCGAGPVARGGGA